MRGALVLLCVAAFATGARAQEVTTGYSSYRTFGIDDLDRALPPSVELRVTIPTSERFAIEPFVAVGQGMLGSRVRKPEGFYGVQIRQRLDRFSSTDTLVFATYGVAAYFISETSGPPVIGHVGVGMRQRLFKRVAVRPEIHMVTLHVMPIGARVVIGMSVDMGR